MSRSLLAVLALAAIALAWQAAPIEQLHCADVGDLEQWQHRVCPSRDLQQELTKRSPAGIELHLRHDRLLYRGNDADVKAVWNMLEQLRDEAGTREVARAAQARRSLQRDYDDQYGRLLIKATWTGSQTKPVPGLAIHSTSRLFTVEPFRAFRRKSIHYGNDDIPVFRSFALDEAGMQKLTHALLDHELCEAAMQRTEARDWSITVLDTSGARRPNYLELLLDADEGGQLFAAMRESIADNATAAAVLDGL